MSSSKYRSLNFNHAEINELLTKIQKGFVLTEAEHKKLFEEIGIDNISSFDGDYESLENKPVIPDKVSMLNNDAGFQTQEQVDIKLLEIRKALEELIANLDHHEKIDLAPIEEELNRMAEEMASKELVNQLIADLIDAAPETMDTLKELADSFEEHGDVFEGFLQEQEKALAKKADKEEIPSLDGLASEEFVMDQIANIEFPEVDLEPFAKKEDLFSKDYNELINLPEIPDVSYFVTGDLLKDEMQNVKDYAKIIIDEQIGKVNDEYNTHIVTLYDKCKALKAANEQEVADRAAMDDALKTRIDDRIIEEITVTETKIKEKLELVDVEMEKAISKVEESMTDHIQKINEEHNTHIVTLYDKCKTLKAANEQEIKDRKAEDELVKDELNNKIKDEIELVNANIEDKMQKANDAAAEMVDALKDEHTEHIVALYDKCKDLKETNEQDAEDIAELFELINEMNEEKYVLNNLPKGTLVDFREKEIRVMCPEGTVFEKQQVGPGGNANMYYMSLVSKAPEGAVKLIESDGNKTETIDLEGKKSKTIWLALANLSGEVWNYFGKTSSTKKYIGWTYTLKWLDENDNVIESDSFRINLANENCYNAFEPSCVGAANAEIAALKERIEALEAIINSLKE